MVQKNDHAPLGYPLYLFIVVLLLTLILTFFFMMVVHTKQETDIYTIQKELETIITEATMMYDYATEGSTVTLSVSFPSSMNYLLFGSLPQHDPAQPLNLTLQENTSNNYYFMMDDGQTFTFHSNARFSSDNLTKCAVFYPGSYTLILNLTFHEGKTYVKVYKQ